MSIYKNAIDSIKVGIEDMQSTQSGRVISGLRNIHAGILLLIKEMLVRLSPKGSDEVLIKQNIQPTIDASGKLSFTGKGKKTVDIQQMTERCKSLGISIDWKQIEEITRIRNDSEHYYTKIVPKAIQGSLAKSFIVIRDLLNQLKIDPRKALGEEAWRYLLKNNEVYKKERDVCRKLIEQVDWESSILESAILGISCSVCGSDLLSPMETDNSYYDTDLECRSCGILKKFHEYAEEALKDINQPNKYLVMTDGNDEEIIDCPHCGEFGYVMEEVRCALCGESAEHKCALCSNTIPASEINVGSLCGYCQHVLD